MKTRVSLKYFVNDSLWKRFFVSMSPHVHSNLFCWTILVTLRPLTQFQPKVRATTLQKSAKYDLTS